MAVRKVWNYYRTGLNLAVLLTIRIPLRRGLNGSVLYIPQNKCINDESKFGPGSACRLISVRTSIENQAIAISLATDLTSIRRSLLRLAVLIFLFVVVTLIFQEPAETAFGAVQSAIAEGMGWFFILSVSLYLGFVVLLAFSKFGKIRLGGQDAKPEFSTFAWVAMLMSAGHGHWPDVLECGRADLSLSGSACDYWRD